MGIDRPLVLLAETDEAVQKLQRYFLEASNFAVEFVMDGEAALNYAALHHPAVVVTEILLPKMDGLAMCRSLRADAATADIPILVFSILNAAARAREAGAQAFLRKPLVETSFVSTIQSLVMPASLNLENKTWASH